MVGRVPQSSVLRLILWDLVFDQLLEMELPGDSTAIAYANNLLLLAEGKTMDDVEGLPKHFVHKISEWLQARGMNLAPQKIL